MMMMMTVIMSGSVKMRLNELTLPSDRENDDIERHQRKVDIDEDDNNDDVGHDDDNDDDDDDNSRSKKKSRSSQLMGDGPQSPMEDDNGNIGFVKD